MATMYKKRRQAFEGEEGRMQAVKRMRDEASIRSKLGQMRQKVNREKEPISHGPPEKQLEAANRMTGKTIPGHRMTLGQALSRRTTATSRQRVLDKYGVSGGPGRSFKPIQGGGGGPLKRPGGPAESFGRGDKGDGTYGAGLNQVAKMRQKVTARGRIAPQGPLRRRRKLPSSGGNRHYL